MKDVVSATICLLPLCSLFLSPSYPQLRAAFAQFRPLLGKKLTRSLTLLLQVKRKTRPLAPPQPPSSETSTQPRSNLRNQRKDVYPLTLGILENNPGIGDKESRRNRSLFPTWTHLLDQGPTQPLSKLRPDTVQASGSMI